MGLRLSIGDETQAVPARVVPGFPAPFRDVLEGIPPGLWRFLLRLPALEATGTVLCEPVFPIGAIAVYGCAMASSPGTPFPAPAVAAKTTDFADSTACKEVGAAPMVVSNRPSVSASRYISLSGIVPAERCAHLLRTVCSSFIQIRHSRGRFRALDSSYQFWSIRVGFDHPRTFVDIDLPM